MMIFISGIPIDLRGFLMYAGCNVNSYTQEDRVKKTKLLLLQLKSPFYLNQFLKLQEQIEYCVHVQCKMYLILSSMIKTILNVTRTPQALLQ